MFYLYVGLSFLQDFCADASHKLRIQKRSTPCSKPLLWMCMCLCLCMCMCVHRPCCPPFPSWPTYIYTDTHTPLTRSQTHALWAVRTNKSPPASGRIRLVPLQTGQRRASVCLRLSCKNILSSRFSMSKDWGWQSFLRGNKIPLDT